MRWSVVKLKRFIGLVHQLVLRLVNIEFCASRQLYCGLLSCSNHSAWCVVLIAIGIQSENDSSVEVMSLCFVRQRVACGRQLHHVNNIEDEILTFYQMAFHTVGRVGPLHQQRSNETEKDGKRDV